MSRNQISNTPQNGLFLSQSLALALNRLGTNDEYAFLFQFFEQCIKQVKTGKIDSATLRVFRDMLHRQGTTSHKIFQALPHCLKHELYVFFSSKSYEHTPSETGFLHEVMRKLFEVLLHSDFFSDRWYCFFAASLFSKYNPQKVNITLCGDTEPSCLNFKAILQKNIMKPSHVIHGTDIWYLSNILSLSNFKTLIALLKKELVTPQATWACISNHGGNLEHYLSKFIKKGIYLRHNTNHSVGVEHNAFVSNLTLLYKIERKGNIDGDFIPHWTHEDTNNFVAAIQNTRSRVPLFYRMTIIFIVRLLVRCFMKRSKDVRYLTPSFMSTSPELGGDTVETTLRRSRRINNYMGRLALVPILRLKVHLLRLRWKNVPYEVWDRIIHFLYISDGIYSIMKDNHRCICGASIYPWFRCKTRRECSELIPFRANYEMLFSCKRPSTRTVLCGKRKR